MCTWGLIQTQEDIRVGFISKLQIIKSPKKGSS